jgi:hypothetical protein
MVQLQSTLPDAMLELCIRRDVRSRDELFSLAFDLFAKPRVDVRVLEYPLIAFYTQDSSKL